MATARWHLRSQSGQGYLVQCDCDLPPPENLLSLRYSDKISRTDRVYGQTKTHQRASQSSPDPLAATLRCLGASLIDRENGRLLRISNYEFAGPELAFRIQFGLADGTRVQNDLSQPALDELSISFAPGEKTTRPAIRKCVGGRHSDARFLCCGPNRSCERVAEHRQKFG